MKAERDIDIILCRCRGSLDRRIDLGGLTEYLTALAGVRSVRIRDNLCRDPGALKEKRSGGLVVAACSNRHHVDLFKETLEGAKVSRFRCSFLDLQRIPGEESSSPGRATEAARLIIKAHVKKVVAASEAARRARASGVREVLRAPREAVTRRGFLRLPLMGARIIAHYEDVPLFDESRCIANRSPCRECIRGCPFQALEMKNGKIQVVDHACRQCGLCAIICPSDAVQMPSFSPSQGIGVVDALADRTLSVEHRSLIFTCDKGLEMLGEEAGQARYEGLNPLTVQVPCVAALSPLILLRSLELGFESVIPLCPDRACPKGKARNAWEDLIDSLFKVIETADRKPGLAVLTLDRGAGSLSSQILDHLLATRVPGPLKPHPAELSFQAREDLIRVLEALVNDRGVSVNPMEGLSFPFFDIQIDAEHCCLCGSCVRQCPAGAMEMVEGKDSRIEFSTSRCVGCGRCVEICPDGAVSIRRVTDLKKLAKAEAETKARDERARCRGCGKVIGRKGLLNEVEKRLRRSGFESLAEGVHYCGACKKAAAAEDK